MAFNSNTYYLNKYQREAWERLAEARARKARGDCPEAIGNMVKLARISMHMCLGRRRLRELSK